MTTQRQRVLSNDLPKQINEAATRVISAILERLLPQVGPDLHHCHLSLAGNQRWTDDRELIVHGIEISFSACTTENCLEPDDGGISEWLQLPNRAVLIDTRGRLVRSDEAMAAAAIQSALPECRVEKIPEECGTTDLLVTFPDRTKALVEVTMHTDSGRRELQHVNPRPLRGDLRHDWHIRLMDSRGKGWYGNDDGLDLRRLQPILLDAIQQVESDGGDLNDQDLIAKACEKAIAEQWHDPLTAPGVERPPLVVVGAEHFQPQRVAGTITVTVGPCTFNVRNVVDVTDLKAAIQKCIVRKLSKKQWGDTLDRRWLAVVLDDTEAADQLVGDAFQLDDYKPDFSDLDMSGLDEVWAIALHDKKLTVLRFMRSSTNWEHRAALAAS